MRFIKFIALCIFIFVSACAQLPVKQNKSDEKHVSLPQSEEQSGTGETAENIAPFVAIPRPEVESRVTIPSQARDEFSRAKQAMIKKNWKEAESILLLMTNTYPELAGVYTNLGIVYGQMGELEKAENAYRFALKTNPMNFDAYTNLGINLREQGKFNEAEQNYLAALERWPHHQPSVLNLGILYDMYLGKLEEALAYYQLAQQLNDEEDRVLKGWIIDLQRRLPGDN